MSSNDDYSFSISAATTPIAATIGYISLIIALPHFLPSSKKLDVKTPLLFHNAFLSIGSFVLFCLFARSWIEIILKKGFSDGLICDADQFGFDRMQDLIYIFLLSKYYEFIDTIFLIIKNPTKPVPSLHFIHHTLTMWVIWAGYETRFTVMSIACVINLFIHTIMYGYWAAKGVYPRYNPWWKKHLTQFQMIQFGANMIGLLLWKAQSTNTTTCSGSMAVYYAVQGTMIIFLILFALWYGKKYTTRVIRKKFGTKKL